MNVNLFYKIFGNNKIICVYFEVRGYKKMKGLIFMHGRTRKLRKLFHVGFGAIDIKVCVKK